MKGEKCMAEEKSIPAKPIATIKKMPVIKQDIKKDVEEKAAEVKKTAEAKKTAVKAAATKKAADTKKKAADKATTVKKTATAKKTEAKKAVEAKKDEVKKTTEAKKTEVKKAVETKKAEVKKAPAKKTTAAKKPAAKKAAPAKAEIKVAVNLQFADKNITYDEIVQNAKNVWQYDKGQNVDDIKSLDLYVKPEEDRVYYVINGTENGNFAL